MSMRIDGFVIDCVELYPYDDNAGGPVNSVTIVMVSKRRTVKTDVVYRRDHQTLLGLLQEVAGQVRHMAGDSS